MRFRPWRRAKRKEELDAEIQSHLDMAARDRIARGEPAAQAEASARRELGNESLVREATADQWGWRWLEQLLQDVRYSLRMLRKSPGFTAVVVLTLALGIGANSAIFSVVNGVLLNPLPFANSDQLVTLDASKPNFETGSVSFPNFLDWQKNNHTFSSMAVCRSYSFAFTGMGDAERLDAELVSSDFFSVLGIRPVIGRTFVQGEDQIGAAPVALLTAGLWSRKFSSSPDVLGKTITLDGKGYTIVGVIPPSFRLDMQNFNKSELFVPIGQWGHPGLPSRAAGLGIHGIGRLKAGVTLAQARADMSGVTANLATAYPETDRELGATLTPLKQRLVGNVRFSLWVLLGAVGFVLLIACVNVANLVLARSGGRTREFAIRAALGASQHRILFQVLTESLLLAFTGGGLGLLLAALGTKGVLRFLPAALPRADEIE
jgi:predicted permease